MSEQLTQPNSQVADDEIDLRELFKALWQGKWIIIVTTLLFSVAAVFYALSLPNVYKSEVTLAPVAEDAGLKIPGQLGGYNPEIIVIKLIIIHDIFRFSA